jgi:alkanesulfonate monooxygenase
MNGRGTANSWTPAIPGVDVFTTCPPSKDFDRRSYLRRVVEVAQWSDDASCRGMLIYTDNGLVDPWLLSQIVLQNTTTLCPLVAIQPIYMHPYTAAKMVSTLALMHERRIYLNMVAGGFTNDLRALDDDTPHDERYSRLVEYTQIITGLLASDVPLTFEGQYYRVVNLRLKPGLPNELFPGILVSGSSRAGLAAAVAIGAAAVKYPQPPGEEEQTTTSIDCGIRVGIIARQTAEEAWDAAHERFPEDRKGQFTHRLAMDVSDSRWHRQLSKLGEQPVGDPNPYWLRPFQNYKTFCPYLVGSYQRVAEEVGRYMALGFKLFILDIPSTSDDLNHALHAIRHAAVAVRS